MSNQATVTLQLTQALLQAAERDGVKLSPDLLARIPESGRTPIDIQDALWDALCSASDDPLFGLKLGLTFQPGHLDIIGLMLMSCENLGEAIEVLLDYYPLVGDAADFELVNDGADCLLVYRPAYTVQQAQRVDAVIACVLNLARWITGNRFMPQRIEYAAGAQTTAKNYTDLLQTSCIFNAGKNAVKFPRDALSIPLIQANPAMCGHLRQLADTALARLEIDSLAVIVQETLRQRPNWGRDRVAEQLGMSGRHLIRRLQEEGTTYRLLRSGILRQQAEEYLAADRDSIAEIADKLGFSDVSAFVKAFKRWTGTTPALFRSNSQ